MKEASFDDDARVTAKARGKAFPAVPRPTFLPLGPGLRRCRPPWRIVVESRGVRPVSMRGRDLDGNIRAAAGPWRLDGGWWDDDAAWGWEEWDVELVAGGLYRLARHRQTDWWMLGNYD